MDVVVGGIPGDDQANGRYVQAGRVVGIGMSEGHDDQIVPLEVNHVFGQFFGQHKLISKLTGKTRSPKRREGLRRCLLAHHLDHLGVATRRARGNRWRTVLAPKKWSPWPCVAEIVVRCLPCASTHSPRACACSMVIK